MFEFNTVKNKDGLVDHIETGLSGNALLNQSKLNKGCAFPLEERERFHLTGLLPPIVETLDQQVARMLVQFEQHKSNITKNIYLNVLHDYNETLFYKLVSAHLETMLPIIYTPTVGEAVQRFSLELRKPRGLYLSYHDRDRLDAIFKSLPAEMDLTVITDGEAVLGIGDQGIGGINISSAKLMVYTLCGGIHPHRVLPIQLDVGTNNEKLLNDPMYLGNRHERISDEAYYDFVDRVINALRKKYPNILVHWEDFGRYRARTLLERYQHTFPTLNGDIQGTGVVALATVLAGVKRSGISLENHRVVIFGAGTAGVGIADQIHRALLRTGLSKEEAYKRFWLIDRNGLITRDSPYARDASEIEQWTRNEFDKIGLEEVVNHIHPTILIGCSAVSNAFSESIIRTMKKYCDVPIILPLSNPTALAEATPEHLLQWTDGTAAIGTGSPFGDVTFNGKTQRIAQSNNALAFPGIGLGVIAVSAARISDDMLFAATEALCNAAETLEPDSSSLLPRISSAKMVSALIAEAVANQAIREGLASVERGTTVKQLIQRTIWEPCYYPYKLLTNDGHSDF